jgi:uncharacterized membrane protein
MTRYLIAQITATVVFAGVDAVWLTAMGQRLYRRELGDVLAAGFRAAPAVLFYLLFPLGIVIFAVDPALSGGGVAAAAGRGALFGFFCYATYDLTNHATLRRWTATVTLADIAWGCACTALAAAAACLAAGLLA